MIFMRKLSLIEVCPIHGCIPAYGRTIYQWKFKCFNHYFFCPKCREMKEQGIKLFGRRLDTFSLGFSLQGSPAAALRNWNNAVSRLKKTLLKKAIIGEEIPDDLHLLEADLSKSRCFDVSYFRGQDLDADVYWQRHSSYCQVVTRHILQCEKEVLKSWPDAVVIGVEKDETYRDED